MYRTTSMGELQQTPYEVLLGALDDVLSEWRALLQCGSLMELPPARLMDSLPEILPRLLRLAWSGASQIDDTLRTRIASDHGSGRRADAVPVTAVADEWGVLKRACGSVLARYGVAGPAAAEAQHRIDVLIDDAIGYTLRGYYQEELNTLRGRGLERRDSPHPDRRRGDDRRERNVDG